jgi:hypothetical protein
VSTLRGSAATYLSFLSYPSFPSLNVILCRMPLPLTPPLLYLTESSGMEESSEDSAEGSLEHGEGLWGLKHCEVLTIVGFRGGALCSGLCLLAQMEPGEHDPGSSTYQSQHGMEWNGMERSTTE